MFKQFVATVFLLLCIPVLALATSSTELPKTGQTSCWDTAGTKIPCSNTGQDGDAQGGKAWSAPRFSNYSSTLGEETVRDSLTGLVWAKDANLPSGAKSWQEALDFVTQKNSGSGFAGFKDWRLPNINELKSLINLEEPSSAVWLNSQGFTNVQADSYWSSSTYKYLNSAAWHVNMLNGYIGTTDKLIGQSYNYFVWMVRDSATQGTVALPKTGEATCYDENGASRVCASTGEDGELQKGVALPSPRFANNGNGTITDKLTGLVWLKDRTALGKPASISSALTAVNNISTGALYGLTDGSLPGDWRLPNRNEMMSLVDLTKTFTISDAGGDLLEAAGFSGFSQKSDSAILWSTHEFCTSSSSATAPNFGWIVYLSSRYNHPTDPTQNIYNYRNGFVDFGDKAKDPTCAAWAVRSGQWGHPIISVTPASKDFGSIAATVTSPAQVVTITNTGKGTPLNAGLSITSIGKTGANAALFTVNPGDGSGGTCGPTPTLPVGASCTISVTFTPDTTGVKAATLSILSNDQTTPALDIPLSGTGTLPTYVISYGVIGGNGSISCTSPITQGGTSICTITPALGYHLANFTDDGVDKISSVVSGSYTIVNVTAGHAISGTFAAGASAKLPKTGQTTCWNVAGVATACAATGQDGDKQGGIDWPVTRFTDNSDGTITDNLTGLMWTKNANLSSSIKTWQSALDYVKTINIATYTDWRLPNINELESVVNEQQSSPASWLNLQGFNNVQSGYYWSSTSNAGITTVAWNVNMQDGRVGSSSKSSNYYVWSVRSAPLAGTVTVPQTGQNTCWDELGSSIACTGTGQDGDYKKGAIWPTSRFVDNSDGTILDNLTGLIWLKDATCGVPQSLASALSMSNTTSTGSCNLIDGSKAGDWRLPNRKELVSMLDRGVADNSASLITQGFKGLSNTSAYWTSSTDVNAPGNEWLVYLKSGLIDFGAKNAIGGQNVWLVRSGQWGHPIVSASPASKNFGNLALNASSTAQVFTITNLGNGTSPNADLNISSFGMNGGDLNQFTVDLGDGSAGTCGPVPINLTSGLSCTVSVVFTPTTAGAKTTKLRLVSNDQTTPILDFALSGTGALPTYNISSSVPGGNGTITCNTPVIQGGTSICNIVPSIGFELLTLTDDGVSQLLAVVSNSYTITPVTADHAIIGTFAPIAPVSGSAVKLPKTGQTGCWNASGASIACASTGQDGDKQGGIGWPTTRFINNNDGTISDSLTGLMWTQNANIVSLKTWQSALDAIGVMNSNITYGHSDWRLPNINEFESLVNEQQSSQAVWLNLQGFNNVQADNYWTSTSNASNGMVAWDLSMLSGRIGTSGKSASLYMWAVRNDSTAGVVSLPQTGQTGCWSELGTPITCTGTGQDGDLKNGAVWPSPRFIDNSDGTVIDNLTGLIWLKNAACSTLTSQTLSNALIAGNTLATGTCGLTDGSRAGDWRLPNRKELISLLDRGVADNSASLIAQGFSGVSNTTAYWTSDTNANALSFEWLAYFSSGQIDFGAKSGSQNVWLIRSGQWGHPVISVSPASANLGVVTISNPSNPSVITISNAGSGTSPNANLNISSLVFAGGNNTLFSVNPGDGTAGTCGAVPIRLYSGTSCTVSVTFTPDSSGAKSTTLKIASDDPLKPNVDIALSGSGAVTTYIVSVTPATNGTITCTSPVAQGGNSVCTITPNTNYILSALTDNTVDVFASVASNKYTITSVVAAHTIIGTFAAIVPVNGVCGSSNGTKLLVAPVGNFCTAGTASAIAGTGPWSWTCAGLYNGSTASCSANKFNPIEINSSAAFTISRKVTLQIYPPNGETMMRVGRNLTSMTKWIPVTPTMDWTLPAGDGQKVVYVTFKNANDSANGSYKAYAAVIVLDTIAPKGTLTINNKARITYDPALDLLIIGKDVSGLAGMCIKETNIACNDSEFESFKNTTTYDLINTIPGSKSIYVTLVDVAGKKSKPIKASITLKSPL